MFSVYVCVCVCVCVSAYVLCINKSGHCLLLLCPEVYDRQWSLAPILIYFLKQSYDTVSVVAKKVQWHKGGLSRLSAIWLVTEMWPQCGASKTDKWHKFLVRCFKFSLLNLCAFNLNVECADIWSIMKMLGGEVNSDWLADTPNQDTL